MTSDSPYEPRARQTIAAISACADQRLEHRVVDHELPTLTRKST